MMETIDLNFLLIFKTNSPEIINSVLNRIPMVCCLLHTLSKICILILLNITRFRNSRQNSKWGHKKQGSHHPQEIGQPNLIPSHHRFRLTKHDCLLATRTLRTPGWQQQVCLRIS
ncbi:hypothetical protein FGO68_gene10583 [Halteria grandinella]|uniref:Uncharacterized protein n=1 Tax=Halteria grandinella TaxID=5974 RepID=A0A8J8P617_HALGN|nr:hypothetical protein FGO68_gene10583 [Halteria grandinella]